MSYLYIILSIPFFSFFFFFYNYLILHYLKWRLTPGSLPWPPEPLCFDISCPDSLGSPVNVLEIKHLWGKSWKPLAIESKVGGIKLLSRGNKCRQQWKEEGRGKDHRRIKRRVPSGSKEERWKGRGGVSGDGCGWVAVRPTGLGDLWKSFEIQRSSLIDFVLHW